LCPSSAFPSPPICADTADRHRFPSTFYQFQFTQHLNFGQLLTVSVPFVVQIRVLFAGHHHPFQDELTTNLVLIVPSDCTTRFFSYQLGQLQIVCFPILNVPGRAPLFPHSTIYSVRIGFPSFLGVFFQFHQPTPTDAVLVTDPPLK